jgi:hypothetical protein
MPQSQTSQFSDHYPPSIFGDNPVDTLSLLPSDGPFNLDGCDTLSSAPNVNFTRPAVPPLIPETLQCVGPTEQKIYILWTEMVNDDFITWWLQTEFGSQMKRNIFDVKHQSGCWDHFEQVAAPQDGTPKVMCKTCNHILAHPADRHRGTTHMNKHYTQGVNCRKLAPRSQDIRQMISNGV